MKEWKRATQTSKSGFPGELGKKVELVGGEALFPGAEVLRQSFP